ncbi:hypothetical protein CR513_40902, partial [Mucuna pruriens]
MLKAKFLHSRSNPVRVAAFCFNNLKKAQVLDTHIPSSIVLELSILGALFLLLCSSELLLSGETHTSMPDSSKSSMPLPPICDNGRRQSHYLGPNELLNLVGYSQFDGRNYLQWAQYVHTSLKGRKKWSHIEGVEPLRDDPKFEAWDDDSLIMTWLWNSMTPEISRNYMFYSSIRKIWENLIETY